MLIPHLMSLDMKGESANQTGLVTTTLPLLLSGANRKCRPLVPLKESVTHTGLVVRVFPCGVRTAVTGTCKHTSHPVCCVSKELQHCKTGVTGIYKHTTHPVCCVSKELNHCKGTHLQRIEKCLNQVEHRQSLELSAVCGQPMVPIYKW